MSKYIEICLVFLFRIIKVNGKAIKIFKIRPEKRIGAISVFPEMPTFADSIK